MASPSCELCARPAVLYCRNDGAFMCRGCSETLHAGNVLAARHTIVPAEQASAPAPEPRAAPTRTEQLSSLLLGPEYSGMEMEASWLDRLDMGFDLVPAAAPAAAPRPAAAGNAAAGAVPDLRAALAGDDDLLVPSFSFSDSLDAGLGLGIFDDAAWPGFDGKLADAKPAAPQQPQPAPAWGLVPLAATSSCLMVPMMAAAPAAPAAPRHAHAYADDSEDELLSESDDEAAAVPVPCTRRKAAGAAAARAPAAALDDASMDRAARVARWREKRLNRRFVKTIRYQSRKAYADIRPRIKGRFARKEEVEAWKAAGCPRNFWDNADQIVPCM